MVSLRRLFTRSHGSRGPSRCLPSQAWPLLPTSDPSTIRCYPPATMNRCSPPSKKDRGVRTSPCRSLALNGIERWRGPWGSPMPLSRCHCSHSLWSGIIVRSSAQNRLSGTTISGSANVKALPAIPLSNTRRFITSPYLSPSLSLFPLSGASIPSRDHAPRLVVHYLGNGRWWTMGRPTAARGIMLLSTNLWRA